MKNTKLTKHIKYNIAKSMYDTHVQKNLAWWSEFVPEIKLYHPFITKTLNWDDADIEEKIIDTRWFRHYIRSQRYY